MQASERHQSVVNKVSERDKRSTCDRKCALRSRTTRSRVSLSTENFVVDCESNSNTFLVFKVARSMVSKQRGYNQLLIVRGDVCTIVADNNTVDNQQLVQKIPS